MKPKLSALMALCLVVFSAQADDLIPVADFVAERQFESMSMSNNGKHLALIVPKGNQDALLVVDVDTMTPTANFMLRKDEHIVDSTWVSNERLVLSMGKRFPGNETVIPTGELFAMNSDGSGQKYLFGFRGKATVGTRINAGSAENASAFLLTDHLADDRFVMIARRTFGPNASTQLCRLDVFSAKNNCGPMPAPGHVKSALADARGQLRWMQLVNADEIATLYYHDEKEWKVVGGSLDAAMTPLGWTGKGNEIFVRWVKSNGPSGLARFDPDSGQHKVLFEPQGASIGAALYQAGGLQPFAVQTLAGKGGFKPLKSGPELEVLKEIVAAFPGEYAAPVQFSDDGKRALVLLQSDVTPSSYYLYEDKKLRALGSEYPQLVPNKMASVEVLDIKARDGLMLEAFITLPRTASEKTPAPVVLLPHGGPFGERDNWHFDPIPQLLASRGYAVLRVNFRGSGGYGLSFEQAGNLQWGKAMQTDLTDALNVVLARKDIDPQRVAAMGGSYGGYAALMAGAQEPSRFNAIVSFAGVTDLDLMFTRGDIEDSIYGQRYLKRSVNRDAALSPVNLADKIKAPVLLVHGDEDDRVPIKHAKAMRDALTAAGNKPVWISKATEGHAFYKLENRVEAYTAILAFLDEHLAKK